MKHLDLSPLRPTSVTLRTAMRERLKETVRLFAGRGIRYSEQRLMRDCLRLALRFWRGQRNMAARSKRYNPRSGPYEIVPFCSTEALRSVCMARCHHSGISLSRLMDFAVRYYLQRVTEDWLRNDFYWRDKADVEIWNAKYRQRKNRSEFIISYASRTEKNDAVALEYVEKYQIEPWPPDLRPKFPN